ncbi:MAG: anhydro-N-acetylmuramic acid kinase, partial [Chitinispirillaceae bacterium]
GDEQFVSSSLNLPVLTDFIRHNILAGGPGILPTFPGSLKIADGTTGIGAFVNIGLVSRMTFIDNNTSSLLLESDTGPGTVLMDKCAKDADCPDGFDRDGKLSSQGEVDAECVEELAKEPWLLKPAPKQGSPEIFTPLLQHPCLLRLGLLDRVATITALTAKSIYDFYRREYTSNFAPEALWISGGGSNNLSLREYLSAYFDPVPVRSIEDLSVPADMKVPLALGLTVNAFLCGHSVPWETGSHPQMDPLARWVLP